MLAPFALSFTVVLVFAKILDEMMVEQERLLSVVGIDYSPLRDLLASGQWKKADEETGALMLSISHRVATGWLREEDIEAFPCLDLHSY